MTKARHSSLGLVLFVVVLVFVGAASSQDFIVMGTPLVNIRTGPSTDHVIIGRAEKGDIFRVVGSSDGWHKIAMFSGEERYVFAADYVYPLSRESFVPGHGMVLAEFKKDLRPIYSDIKTAMSRARKEAEEVIPESVDPARNANFRMIMEDRVILETFHIHGLQPALYGDLMEEARAGNW